MKTLKLLFIIILFLFTVIFSLSIAAEENPVSLAVLPFENMNGNPEQDYLKGIISYILIGDLSSSGKVLIVDRKNINEVMKEQQLQFTGIMDDSAVIETGHLLGASIMLKGSYVFLGQDIFINLSIIDVETGGSRTFSERGYQENTVHLLGEKVLKYLTGKDYTLVNSQGEKTILALDQQEPGVVELFSDMLNSRVYVDEEFSGYTTGNSTVPLVLEVPPGKHIIRTHASKDFGVIDKPEIVFHDWQEEFNLLPVERIVLEDRTRLFNDIIYDIKQLLRKSIQFNIGSGEKKQAIHSVDFTDREGNNIQLELSLIFRETDTPRHGASAELTFRYQDKDYSFKYFAPQGKDIDFSEEIGKVRLDITLECNSSYRYDLDYSIWRTDVWSGMYRE